MKKKKRKTGDASCTQIRDSVSNAAPTVQPASAAPILLTVTRISDNPHMVYAVDAKGNPRGIRVQSSHVYNAQDKLLALPDSAQQAIMLQVGPRPNYKGEPHYRYRLEMELKKLGR